MPFLGLILPFLGSIPAKVWAVFAGVIAVIVLVLYMHHVWYMQGLNHAEEQINAANQHAKEQAEQGQQTVDQCFASGGTWNRDRGVCDHAAGQ